MARSIFLLMLFFTINNEVIAQQNIAGKWKIIRISIADVIYEDIEKDSVVIADTVWKQKESEGQPTDSLTKAMTILRMKERLMPMFILMTFSIDESGRIYENMKHTKVGQYDAFKKSITSVSPDGKLKKTYPLELKDGLLQLISPDDEEEIVMWCRKTN